LAVLNDRYDTAYLLIQKLMCDIDIPDGKSGRTALHHAIDTQNHRMAKLLVHKGADVNALTYDE